MALRRLAVYLSGRRRPFDSLQVEVTTRCLLRCPFCPHEALKEDWTAQDLAMEDFRRLSKAFPLVKFVHLQGWGEPLLHPQFPLMVELAKAAGCQVGFTTNGVLLGENLARRLVDLGLDLIAVSIAGADPATHDSIRVGSHLPAIVENVAALARLKERAGALRPKIVISYIMQRRNVGELPEAVAVAQAMGAQEMVATNLDYLACDEHEAARAFSWQGAPPAFAAAIEEARERAAARGILFRPYPLEPQDGVLICEAMPVRNAVVAADGGVFPCTYLDLPVDPVPRIFEGARHIVPRRAFGSLREAEFLDIWHAPGYREFRRRFELRQKLGTFLLLAGQTERDSSADPAARAEALRRQVEERAPLPERCRTCYKAYGL